LGLGADTRQFPLDIGGQFAASAADEFVSGEGQPAKMLRRGEQRRQIRWRAVGVLGQLIEAGAQFPFGLQQQGLGIAGQFACCQQIGLAEAIEVRQARAQGLGQVRRELVQLFLQVFQRLGGRAEAQGVAAGQVILDVACHFALELPRQAEVAFH
jgi:hypothetical protein